ncbi:MAG: hypothetical protein V3V75_05375 [Thermoguttaceae bacterium]
MLIDSTHKVLKIAGLRPTGDFGPLTGYTSKRGKAVWYLKAPPKTPPTGWQRQQRWRFRFAAHNWRALTPAARANWLTAARNARLNITGYNLFVWFQIRPDRAVIRTIEQQTGITLLD